MANTFYQKGKKYNCVKNGTPYFRKSAVINGKQRSFYGDGEKECLRKIEEAKALEQRGYDYSKHGSVSGTVFRHWLYDIKRFDSNIKTSTFTLYDSQYRRFYEGYPIAKVKLSDLTTSVLQAHLNKMYEDGTITSAGVKEFLKVFKMFCRWAVEEGYMVKNPTSNIVRPGEKKKSNEVETFTKEERDRLVAYMDETDYWYAPLVKLAFETGMRIGELIALRWRDIEPGVIHVRHTAKYYNAVDGEGNTHRVRELGDPKTFASERDIPITASVSDMLQNLHLAQKKYMLKHGLPQTEFVFTTTRGTLIYASSLNSSYNKLLKDAGLPHKKFHSIRHTFATEAIRRGVPVKDVQLLMGHSNIVSTYIYVHGSEESKREAVELIGGIL